MILFPTLETSLISREDKDVLLARMSNMINNEMILDREMRRNAYQGWVKKDEFTVFRKGPPVLTYKPELVGAIQRVDDSTKIRIVARMSAGAQTNVLLQLMFLGGGALLMNWMSITIRGDWNIFTLLVPVLFIGALYLSQIGVFIIEAQKDFAVLRKILVK